MDPHDARERINIQGYRKRGKSLQSLIDQSDLRVEQSHPPDGDRERRQKPRHPERKFNEGARRDADAHEQPGDDECREQTHEGASRKQKAKLQSVQSLRRMKRLPPAVQTPGKRLSQRRFVEAVQDKKQQRHNRDQCDRHENNDMAHKVNLPQSAGAPDGTEATLHHRGHSVVSFKWSVTACPRASLTDAGMSRTNSDPAASMAHS